MENKFSPAQRAYYRKLKDPRWLEFRADFIQSKIAETGLAPECDDCGEDTRGPLHVHHRIYRNNSEPWDYDYSELRLLCEECHARIHKIEKRIRGFVLQIAAHETYELEDFLDELEIAKKQDLLKIALARCKNIVRSMNYGDWIAPGSAE